MAATRKSAKRTAGKKRSSAKPASARKSAGGKGSSQRRTTGRIRKAGKKVGKQAGKVAGKVKKKARKVVRAARGPINSVMDAGEKTWEALKSTTAHMMEGMKGSFGGDERGAR